MIIDFHAKYVFAFDSEDNCINMDEGIHNIIDQYKVTTSLLFSYLAEYLYDYNGTLVSCAYNKIEKGDNLRFILSPIYELDWVYDKQHIRTFRETNPSEQKPYMLCVEIEYQQV